MIDASILVILQELQISILQEKARLLSNGEGIERPEITDMPQDDYFIGAPVKSLDEIMPLPAPKSAKAHIDDAGKTLDELRRAAQITMDEAIADASTETAAQPTAKPEPSRVAQTTGCVQAPELPQLTILERIRIRREALVQWHIDRYQKDYEYDRTRKEIKDKCYGLDFSLAEIGNMIKVCRTARSETEVKFEQ